MGILCCSKPKKTIEDVDESFELIKKHKRLSAPIERQLRINFGAENILNISYSQHRYKGYKDLWEYDHKRILVFSQSCIYVLSVLDPTTNNYHLISFLSISSPNTKFLHGGFVDDHNSNFFMVLMEEQEKYLIRTYRITRNKKPTVLDPALVVGKSIMWESMQKPREEGTKFGKILHLDSRKLVTLSPGDDSSIDNGYKILYCEEQQLQETTSNPIVYIRCFKNITPTYTEMLVASAQSFHSVQIKKNTILAVQEENISRPIKGIEYWCGHYYILHTFNLLAIYKRNHLGKLTEIKNLHITSPDFAGEFFLSKIQIPALYWSDRFPEKLRKETQRYMLFAGNLTQKEVKYKVVAKYDLVENKYIRLVLIESPSSISCLNYGPYDNGPIIVGFLDGRVLAFDSYTFAKILDLNHVGKEEVRCITFEPCKKLLVGTSASVRMYSLTAELFHYSYSETIGDEGRVKIKRIT